MRDLLLERGLCDVDLIVDGADAAALARAAAAPDVRVTIHERFGTVSLTADDVGVDLATVRRETYSHAGALPSVERQQQLAVNWQIGD